MKRGVKNEIKTIVETPGKPAHDLRQINFFYKKIKIIHPGLGQSPFLGKCKKFR
jgi:hypothetical protein